MPMDPLNVAVSIRLPSGGAKLPRVITPPMHRAPKVTPKSSRRAVPVTTPIGAEARPSHTRNDPSK